MVMVEMAIGLRLLASPRLGGVLRRVWGGGYHRFSTVTSDWRFSITLYDVEQGRPKKCFSKLNMGSLFNTANRITAHNTQWGEKAVQSTSYSGRRLHVGIYKANFKTVKRRIRNTVDFSAKLAGIYVHSLLVSALSCYILVNVFFSAFGVLFYCYE